MSNDLILMGVSYLDFISLVELQVRNQFTHYLLKPGSISKNESTSKNQRWKRFT